MGIYFMKNKKGWNMRLSWECCGIIVSLLLYTTYAQGMQREGDFERGQRTMGPRLKTQELGTPMRSLLSTANNEGGESPDQLRTRDGTVFQAPPAPRPAVRFETPVPAAEETTGLVTQRAQRCRCTCSTNCKIASGVLGCCGVLISIIIGTAACQDCCCH